MWHDLLVATALLLVMEGIWPFLNPASLRRAMRLLVEQDDHALRIAGLVSMICGVALLYWVN
jgi:uncharacterized protein YjeT (DUF2065 family)